MIRLIFLVVAIGQGPAEPEPYLWPVEMRSIDACHEIGAQALREPRTFLRNPAGVSRPYLVLAYHCDERIET